MTVHRLRRRRESVGHPRPVLNGVLLADAPTVERTDAPDVPFAVTRFDDWQRRRHALAARYAADLKTLPGLEPLDVATPGRHAHHLYVVRVLEEYGTGRDELIDRLAERGIGTSAYFPSLRHLPYFRRTATALPVGLPGADMLFPQLLSLPLHPFLTERQVDRVCGALARIMPRRPAGSRTHGSRTPRPHPVIARPYPGGF